MSRQASSEAWKFIQDSKFPSYIPISVREATYMLKSAEFVQAVQQRKWKMVITLLDAARSCRDWNEEKKMRQ